MEITKQNLRQAIVALRKCADENRDRIISTGKINISRLCDDVADYLDKEEQQ